MPFPDHQLSLLGMHRWWEPCISPFLLLELRDLYEVSAEHWFEGSGGVVQR